MMHNHMKSTAELVTPEIAKKWMEENTENRPISQFNVRKYARRMTAGKWKLTHQAVGITDDGRILDGQHRLLAIILSDTPVWLYITRGCDADTFAEIDGQKVRSGSDALAIAGFDEHQNLPGMLKLVRLYDEFRNDGWNSQRARLDNDQVIKAAVKAGQPAVDAVDLAWKVRRLARSGPLPAYATAIYLIQRESGIPAADQFKLFWEPYGSGVGLGKGDPRLALKRTVDRNYISVKGAAPEVTRPMLGLMLKAWNAFVAGREVQVLSFKESEGMPDVARFH